MIKSNFEMYQDLTKRIYYFCKATVSFCNKLSKTIILIPLISQLIRSSTSIGANYCEAVDAYSTKDYLHKLNICRKESKESKFWLLLIKEITPVEKLDELIQEAHELNLILSKIIINKKRKNKAAS